MADQEVEEQEQERDELERQIRTSKALQAMEKELQLSTAVVMPVLMKLLKTFDGKWEHIEDENYRLLADMIFQQQEAAEAEEAPGSSSGRKPVGKKEKKATRAAPRRAPRNSKRAESDDSDEHGHSHELIRRSKRAPVDAFTHAAVMAQLERAVVAGRGRAATARQAAAEDALPPPRSAPPQVHQCQEPQRELRARVDKQTQTEEADFESLTLPIQPTAIVCYGEPVPESQPSAMMPPVVKSEAPVFLPAAEVRRQILNHVAPLKSLSGEVCRKCEKPKAVVSDPGKAVTPDALTSMVYDPSRVKIEGQAAPPSSKRKDVPLMCLNPEPLQTVVPPSTQPLPLAVLSPQHFEATEAAGVEEVHTPEPLLLTFPSEPEGAGGTTSEMPKVPCSVQAAAEVAVQVDTNETLSEVENPVEVKVEVQQPTENSITEGALAALASYVSESDNEDPGMSPKGEPGVMRASEGLEQGHEEALPLANSSSIAVLAGAEALNVANSGGENLERGGEEKRQSSGNTSSESSKKRKRHLIKRHEMEQAVIEEKRKQRYDREDISRGKEKVPISLSAPYGEELPREFYYINASVVFQSAHVGISMARIGEDDRCSGCVGNCLDNRTPCECARMTNGEFAYTVEGYLYPHFLDQELKRKGDMKYLSFCQPGACPVERTNDEPCKGHIQRRFIKECWEKCGCTQLCGNRIVQRGIAHKLQVFWTEGGKGWGVRTLEHLPAGAFVCEYVGEILTNTEMWSRNNDVHRAAKHSFVLNIDADWNSEKILKDEEALCLDGTYYGNVSRFINHRCVDSNLFDIPVEIESPDHHYYHLAFFTSKAVNVNEELTWDYGLDFNDKDHQIQAFECRCGSSFCRGKVEDGKPWV